MKTEECPFWWRSEVSEKISKNLRFSIGEETCKTFIATSIKFTRRFLKEKSDKIGEDLTKSFLDEDYFSSEKISETEKILNAKKTWWLFTLVARTLQNPIRWTQSAVRSFIWRFLKRFPKWKMLKTQENCPRKMSSQKTSGLKSIKIEQGLCCQKKILYFGILEKIS